MMPEMSAAKYFTLLKKLARQRENLSEV